MIEEEQDASEGESAREPERFDFATEGDDIVVNDESCGSRWIRLAPRSIMYSLTVRRQLNTVTNDSAGSVRFSSAI